MENIEKIPVSSKRPTPNRLVMFFKRNGYIREPDENRRKKDGQSYKKGYEIRFVVNDKTELVKVKSLLHMYGFKVGKPFKKRLQTIIPVYGKDAVEKFRKILSKY